MMTNTAIGAVVKQCDSTHNLIFTGKEHMEFYQAALNRCRYQDVYHQVLCYCLGIDKDTRAHIERIYDFESGSIITECINEGWQTGGSRKVVRLAFNLYTDGTPTTYDSDDCEEQVTETGRYSVSDLFCCSYANYFFQAIQIRYPEYTKGERT